MVFKLLNAILVYYFKNICNFKSFQLITGSVIPCHQKILKDYGYEITNFLFLHKTHMSHYRMVLRPCTNVWKMQQHALV